jgi:Ca2+-binding RTX toxin-like protein
VINGGDGNDIMTGRGGDDVVTGGRGNDVALLGAGDDMFTWNPGEGSDGGRARLFRDVGNVTTHLNGVERIELNALGGADNITVNDPTGTDVDQVAIDLALPSGSTMGDGQVDAVVINATNGDGLITVTNNNGVVTVSGLAAEVTISGFEATDCIVINGLGGGDVIKASGLGTAMMFTANGGDGDDVLIGSAGNDTLSGGAETTC